MSRALAPVFAPALREEARALYRAAYENQSIDSDLEEKRDCPLSRLVEQSLSRDRTTDGTLHPELRREPALLRHALELGAEVAAAELLVELEGDDVAERVVGKVEAVRDHVGIDREKVDVLHVEDRRVVTVPDVLGD